MENLNSAIGTILPPFHFLMIRFFLCLPMRKKSFLIGEQRMKTITTLESLMGMQPALMT